MHKLHSSVEVHCQFCISDALLPLPLAPRSESFRLFLRSTAPHTNWHAHLHSDERMQIMAKAERFEATNKSCLLG
jgi:hypothetical protein